MSAPLSLSINLSPQKLEIETKTRSASMSDILGIYPCHRHHSFPLRKNFRKAINSPRDYSTDKCSVSTV